MAWAAAAVVVVVLAFLVGSLAGSARSPDTSDAIKRAHAQAKQSAQAAQTAQGQASQLRFQTANLRGRLAVTQRRAGIWERRYKNLRRSRRRR